ncbi:iron complex outermembrane receptor protein [Endobacter medicaginis]|uniref:Iron complex outermembrane receptor protein n=1 Tax=Endobacter medicaginis TaxID=1181271 RepID=A0A850NUI6_9PROT|nr:TonB-dependent receptor [Endobacter medicaginis]MBB3173073.1 iron complex outermembrane receptor protein [Endobacter medicaginis]MCX5474502.1 TonB-dependent receptor plug domain-containing protein [Endobacter medicaginis]NVN30528.1 TonB-dependent receptor plug domain-containing protein [Endobacter medicaginis]
MSLRLTFAPACRSALFMLGTSSLSHVAFAQTATLPAVPAKVAKSAAAATRNTDESIVVRAVTIHSANGVTGTTPGGGLLAPETAPKAQQTITRDFIAKQSPASAPISLIQYVPGVTLSNGDAFGQSDTSSNFYMRGLSQTSVGYTFEGIPAADPSAYTPFTSQASDTENIGRLTVQPGVVDIDNPVYNSVAGGIQQYMTDPARTFGGQIDLSYGNHQFAREFLRLDSGELGRSGITAFASYSYGTNAMWLGPGRERRSHVDALAKKEWGDGNAARIFLTYTQQSFPFLQSISLAQWQTQGRSAAYYEPTYIPGDGAYWKLNAEERHSVIIGAPLDFTLGSGLHLHTEPYYVHQHGAGNDGQPQAEEGYNGTRPTGDLNIPNPADDGTALVLAVDNFNQHTTGINNVLTWERGHNTFKAGWWYNYYDQSERAPFAVVGDNGEGSNYWGKYPILDQYGDPLMVFNIHLIQQVNALFVSDTYRFLHDRLKVTAGFKYAMLTYHSTNAIPGDPYNYGRSDAQPLPQLLASYQLATHDQLFFNVGTAFREPSGILTYGQLWDGNAPVVDQQASTNLKSEYSISEELGWRHSGLVNINASLFNYDMTNRQSSYSTYVQGRLVPVGINAGGQTSRGVSIAAGLRPWHGFSPYASFQYLHATLGNNLPRGTDYVPTKGKFAINTPKITANVGLSYDDGHFFANAYMSYVGRQYATFVNDQSIPGYAIGNVGVGYRLGDIGPARAPQIQLNILNVTDNKYLAAGGGAYNAKPVKGLFGSTINPGTPLYTVGGGFGLVVSIASGF